jgi:hypothetical protein
MNYFEYFTEIEERFSRRRGSILLLNTLDWALIETWREAGIPLEAVLRGIDDAFDKHDARAAKARGRSQKVNGLAWCSQAVMHAAEEMVEASTGLSPTRPEQQHESGFESERVAAYLDRNADQIKTSVSAAWKGTGFSPSIETHLEKGALAPEGIQTTASRLRELAATMRSTQPLALDELDRTLTVLEDKLFAALQASATEQELVDLHAQADRELAPYRAKMSAVQLRQVQSQFLRKRLLELRSLPRLSLFYMGHGE